MNHKMYSGANDAENPLQLLNDMLAGHDTKHRDCRICDDIDNFNDTEVIFSRLRV